MICLVRHFLSPEVFSISISLEWWSNSVGLHCLALYFKRVPYRWEYPKNLTDLPWMSNYWSKARRNSSSATVVLYSVYIPLATLILTRLLSAMLTIWLLPGGRESETNAMVLEGWNSSFVYIKIPVGMMSKLCLTKISVGQTVYFVSALFCSVVLLFTVCSKRLASTGTHSIPALSLHRNLTYQYCVVPLAGAKLHDECKGRLSNITFLPGVLCHRDKLIYKEGRNNNISTI